jgi:hypothetical protein
VVRNGDWVDCRRRCSHLLWILSSRTHTRSAAIPLGFRDGAWAKVWENGKGLDLTGAEDGAQKPATPDAMVATPAKARTALLELISQRGVSQDAFLPNDQTEEKLSD